MSSPSSRRRSMHTAGSPITSREEEKDQLRGLNSRLAELFDRIKSLENEREEHSHLLEHREEELEETRIQLGVTKSENEKINAELAELKLRIKQNERELAKKDDLNRKLEDQLTELRKLLDKKERELVVTKKKFGKEADARKNAEKRFESLEKECMERYNQTFIDSSDPNTSYVEGLEELRQLHEKQGSPFRTRAETLYSSRIKKIEKLEERYKSETARLEKELRDLQQKYSNKDQENGELKAKLRDQETKAERFRSQSVHSDEAREELKRQLGDKDSEIAQLKNKIKKIEKSEDRYKSETTRLENALRDLESRYKDKERETDDLETKLSELKTNAERFRDDFNHSEQNGKALTDELEEKDREIARLTAENKSLTDRLNKQKVRYQKEKETLKEKLVNDAAKEQEEQLKQYQDLMDIKLSLDAEILAYRTLLDREESRISKNEIFSPKRSQTPKNRRKSQQKSSSDRPAKTRRMDTQETVHSTTAVGHISIEKSDREGDYIQLLNNSDLDQNLWKWSLKRLVDWGEELSYTFNNNYVLRGGETVKVWSTDAWYDSQLTPGPTDLLSANSSWGTGRKIETTLVDSSDRIVATRSMKLEVITSQKAEDDSFVDEVRRTSTPARNLAAELNQESTVATRERMQTRSKTRQGFRRQGTRPLLN